MKQSLRFKEMINQLEEYKNESFPNSSGELLDMLSNKQKREFEINGTNSFIFYQKLYILNKIYLRLKK